MDKSSALFISSLLESDAKSKSKTFHFFSASRDLFLIHAFSHQAQWIAKKFYNTLTVLKRENHLESLAITRKMFGRICLDLLQRNMNVQIWAKNEDKVGSWKADRFATPGNYSELDMFTEIRDVETASAAIHVIRESMNLKVGISIVNTTTSTLFLLEFVVSEDFASLESVLMQYGIREVIVAAAPDLSDLIAESEEEPSLKRKRRSPFIDLAGPLQRVGVSIVHAHEQFKVSQASAASTMTELTRLCSHPEDECTSSVLAAAETMPVALATTVSLLQHIHAFKNHSLTGGFCLCVGEVGDSLVFDASANKALAIFPRRLSAHIQREVALDEAEGNIDDLLTFQESNSSTKKDIKKDPSFLFGLINHTLSPMGDRNLRRWVHRPLCDKGKIEARLLLVEFFVSNCQITSLLREGTSNLLRFPDLERLLIKIREKNPRSGLVDMLSIYRCILRLESIHDALQNDNCALIENLLAPLAKVIADLAKFKFLVEDLVDMERLKSKDRSFGTKWVQVRPSFSPMLSQVHSSIEETLPYISQEKTVVSKLLKIDAKQVHIENNSIHGYHFRVTKKNHGSLKNLGEVVSVISIQNAGVLFHTVKLKSLSKKIEALKLEYEREQVGIISQALAVAVTYAEVLRRASSLVSDLDALTALAHVAVLNEWTKPSLVDREMTASSAYDIEGLRHPSLAYMLGAKCVANNYKSSSGRFAIITGPNMGTAFA